MSQENGNSFFLGIPLSVWKMAPDHVRIRLDYASYLSTRHKYVYIETPKAACTRLKTMIHRLEGLPPVNPPLHETVDTKRYMFIYARHAFPMPSLVQLPETRAASILHGNEFFKFCFVRNPYSRLFSVWRNKIYLVEPGFENPEHESMGNIPGSL